MKLKSLLQSVVALILVLMFTTACRNTASGFGKDVEKAGEKIQDKVD